MYKFIEIKIIISKFGQEILKIDMPLHLGPYMLVKKVSYNFNKVTLYIVHKLMHLTYSFL